ncbi:DUF3160 domain-containing protein [Treponema sp. OMZ 788]|uniref:DUF3160 domain-containing protein n=1 Tax=Treponema sp. OMZ 788 TaxID=2563664 RepID=UPI0020A54890|nr:DUF3160 domain-containing protein [Treponema sp. OMZ 788]UTC64081.1 DUF3160 domain-containing protein [Treponema sp. OMZ 788]
MFEFKKKGLGLIFMSVLFICVLSFFSCNAKERNEQPADKADTAEPKAEVVAEVSEPEKTEESSASKKSIETIIYNNLLNSEFEKKTNAPKAHQKYLHDKLVFKDFPFSEVKQGKTAVVGSDVCLFYPNAELKSEEDLEKLPKGIPIPFGTVLNIEEDFIKLPPKDENDEFDFGVFSFQENQNYFYRTIWNGEKGLVFGADLTGLDNDLKKNQMMSMRYLTNGAPKEFYPVFGYDFLSKDHQALLERDRLIFEKVKPDEYYMNIMSGDDMIALYGNHYGYHYDSYGDNYNGTLLMEDGTTLFITTDLMAHAKHLLFDRTLQSIEEKFFVPRLLELVTAFEAGLNNVNQKGFPTARPETLEKAKLYFQVARALLELAPESVTEKNEYGSNEVVYKEPDRNEVLAKYPKTVSEEINLIDEAQGPSVSPLFTFEDEVFTKEDYSQYKPRGHYTKNGILSAYFRAMMWFGRTHFLIADKGPEVLAQDGTAASDADALTLHMEPIALLITELVKNDEELYKKWAALFDPITDLIGLSDDLSFKEVLPLWKHYNVKDFEKWASDKNNLLAFMKSAHEKLRPPAIAGSSAFYTAAEGTDEERRPPMGWRLFGQRFIFDSYVHGLVSSPRMYGRTHVKGLDIMKAMGSKSADVLLQKDYSDFHDLKTVLDKIEKEAVSSPDEILGKTYYGKTLKEIALQARFEQGSGFYFTESPAWSVKSLLSAHGTWAELRHDTILYTKQAFAGLGGGPGADLTYRIKKVPYPVHYIEPNLAFWENAASSVDVLINALKPYNLIDEKNLQKLEMFKKTALHAADIVKLEIADKPVSEADLKWITVMPAFLARILMPSINAYVEPEQLRMALVADVFTNAEAGFVLETAVGIPYRIYVPLNDAQGGKRIAVGYCFNYYEFEQDIANRLTNEEWKKRVYADEDMEDLKPFWAQNISF